MKKDLIKTPVTVVEEQNIFRMLDADGETVMISGNANPTAINRIRDTLNVLSGLLSGDPNGTATKEERELWRASAIRWSQKVELACEKLIQCHEETDAEWGTGKRLSTGTVGIGVKVYEVPDAQWRDIELEALINILKTGKESTHTKPPKPAGKG